MSADTSPAAIRAALLCISPDGPRDEWAKVGMAIKSALGDEGADLFLEWSSRGASYNERDARDTWRSVKAGGGVRIGTLFHLAKQHGYKPERKPNGADSANGPTGSKGRNGAHARHATAASEAAADADRHRRGAEAAARLWASGSDKGASEYLARKGVGAHGVRFTSDRALLVPMRDASGALANVQSIRAGREPADAAAKRFVKDARKRGCFHLLGDPAGATWLLIAEGYATAATLFEATARPVACAFDAGNLGHVARALRELHPQARIAICGDDDRDTAARTGRNPGREKAEAAARAVGGVTVFPQGLPSGRTDWNDLAAVAAAEVVANLPESERATLDPTLGLERVRVQVEGALQGVELLDAASTPSDPPKDAQNADDEAASDRFRIDEGGVWFDPPDDGGDGGSRPIRVCGRLRGIALARDASDGAGALLVEFDGVFGTGRRWLMPLAALAGDGTAYRAELLAQGFMVPVDAKRRALLTLYLQTRRPRARVRLTDKTGWHGRRFVLPRETLGDDPKDRLMFTSDIPVESPFAERGTLAGWRDRIARPCIGNTRLAFAVSAAFAGPALALVGGVDGGGVHFVGDSSTGKSTLLKAAASVWGGPDYRAAWRATTNGLESLASAHSDATLILDELAMLDPREAGEAAYLLSNGVGKARAGRTGAARPRLTWRLVTLSAGEIDLSAHMDDAGRRMRAGQELRLASIPADAGSHLGVFEQVHEFDDPGALAQHLARSGELAYGTAGRAWLEHLTENFDDATRALQDHVDAIASAIVPEAASGQVQRVGRRFALIAASGEVATAAGLTGWPIGEATRAARACFNAWIESRPGGIGQSEDELMLRQVRAWFAAHGNARFEDWVRGDDHHAPRTMHRAGWRKRTTVEESSDEYFVAVDVFRSEVCKGFSDRAVLRLLKALGHLHTEGKGFTCSASPPGAPRAQVVRVCGSILQERAE